MPNFEPTQVEFGDIPGYGVWDIGHWREHIAFTQVLAGQATPILLPNYDFGALLSGGPTVRESFDSHQAVHGLLRQLTGVGGVDYTDFRLDQQTDFYSFLGYHEIEHSQLRQALGLT